MRRVTRIFLAAGLAISMVPLAARAQDMSLGGVGAASGIAAGMGAMSAGNLSTKNLTKGVGQPDMPEMDAGGGNRPVRGVSGGGASSTTTTTTVTTERKYGGGSLGFETGQNVLSELLAGSRSFVPIPETKRMTSRQRAAYSRRLRNMTAAQRSREVAAKYQKPPVGWLKYYLKDDRYKMTAGVWRYVTIEDDAAAYPVRYYYAPSSARMLNILSRRQRGGPLRNGRVIGFRTWREAMLAGYRPDPISRPAPAADLVFMARAARTPALATYVEKIYSGQISPEAFAASASYSRTIVRIVQSRADTRKLLYPTMAQVYSAFIGEGSLPTQVGGGGGGFETAPAEISDIESGEGGGSSTEQSAGGPDAREEEFNKFGSRAGKLANTPGNNR